MPEELRKNEPDFKMMYEDLQKEVSGIRMEKAMDDLVDFVIHVMANDYQYNENQIEFYLSVVDVKRFIDENGKVENVAFDSLRKEIAEFAKNLPPDSVVPQQKNPSDIRNEVIERRRIEAMKQRILEK